MPKAESQNKEYRKRNIVNVTESHKMQNNKGEEQREKNL